MNGASPDPLANLADIHLPPPVPDFPWAWGWWLLLALAVAILLALAGWLRQRRRRNAFRRAALAELAELSDQVDEQQFAAALNQLLRRVARHSLGKHCLGLTGAAWRQCINQAAPHGKSIDDGLLASLEQAAYRPSSPDIDRQQLCKQVALWIRHHREVAP